MGDGSGLLEPHDSFFIGSDVFYTFLVQNKIWWVRQKQKDPAHFLEGAEKRGSGCLKGHFRSISSGNSATCSIISVNRRSSSVQARCWKTTTATRLPENMKVSSARTGAAGQAARGFYVGCAAHLRQQYERRGACLSAQRGCWIRMSRWRCWCSVFRAHRTANIFSRRRRVWDFPSIPMCGANTSTPRRGCCDWCSGWARGRWTARTMIIRGSSLSMRRIKSPRRICAEARQFAQQRVDLLDLEKNQLCAKRFEEVVVFARICRLKCSPRAIRRWSGVRPKAA